LPAASMALTLKVWEPWAKPVYVLGEEQLLKAPLSREHSKVEFASEEEKVNDEALFCFMVFGGPEFMKVSGAVVSGGGGAVPAIVVKDQLLSEASGLPARSLTPLAPPKTVAV
jgi:hypothetical protein